MSHPVNTAYLEDIHERFNTTESGFERCGILLELRESGFTTEVDTLIGEWYIERAKFLEDAGVEEHHLMHDEDDATVQYWKEEHELGTPGDDYQIDMVRVEVPTYLNVDYWLDYKDINTKHG